MSYKSLLLYNRILFILLGSIACMVWLPRGSTDPTTWGFYYSIFFVILIEFTVTWVIRKFQKGPGKSESSN